MQRRIAWAGGLVLGIGLFLGGGPAQAVIMRLTPLSEILTQTKFIFVVKVEKVYADKPALVLTVSEQLKGKLPFRRLPINLTGDSDAQKEKHTKQMRKRLAAGMRVILFATERGKRYTVFGFSNGTWFQVIGRKTDEAGIVRWMFTHCEPYLRRTYAGSTDGLKQIVIDGLSGKKKPPAPNPKEKPGLGPEIPKKDKETRRQGDKDAGSCVTLSPCHLVTLSPGLPFAVIPTLGLGGPLALLAMLFPGLFGGTLLVFRKWMALLTVAGLNSTLLLLALWFPRLLRGTWLGTGSGLWFTMLLLTLVGTLWAWRRHSTPQPDGAGAAAGPSRSEQVMLWISSVAFLVAFLICCLGHLVADDPGWKLVLVLTVGFWAGALYLLGRRLFWRPAGRPALPTEGVILWSMVVASTCLAAAWPGRASVSGKLEGAEEEVVRQAWQVSFTKPGFVVSSPLVHDGKVYVATATHEGADRFGAVYCLNAETGKQVWEYNNDDDMAQVFSGPCVVDGRLYIGEGFHQDKDCRLYCLDARTGKEHWKFPTKSHTESTPCVAGGKVFFGAGDDGVYCVDVKTGKKVWQYPRDSGDTTPTVGATKKKLKLHIDASPLLVGDRLYVGSGVDRDSPDFDPAVFCLDANSGKKLWLMALGNQELPAWGSPVAAGGRVFFGLGNGDMLNNATNPTGALLCVEAKTGKELWRYKVANSVLRKPVVDDANVYFGARDGFCYCLNQKDGKRRWKREVGSPVVASPALFRCAHCGTARLYVVGTGGQVRCYHPETGTRLWSIYYGEAAFLSATPYVAVVHTPQGERRRLYLGAGHPETGMPAALYCVEER